MEALKYGGAWITAILEGAVCWWCEFIRYFHGMYLLSFIRHIISKAVYVITERRKETKWATTRLRELERQLGGRLDAFTFHKIVNSYAIYTPMVCDAFTALRGRITNRGERDRMLHYFICSSLFDNFCDRKELNQESLQQISFSPEIYNSERFDERLFQYAHLLLKDFVRDKAYYETVTRRLFQAQMDSDKQFHPDISDAVIERITLDKGGYAVLLCHFYLDDVADEAEQQCWYQIGGVIQFTNDLYDIYKDYQDGVATLPNRMRDAYAFHAFFMQLVEGVKREIALLPFSSKRKRQLTLSMMSICSFGLVAIRQLQSIQGDKPALPNLRELPRKELVIDMEKNGNRWYCISQVYRLTRSLV
jgi:hypothetical protein